VGIPVVEAESCKRHRLVLSGKAFYKQREDVVEGFKKIKEVGSVLSESICRAEEVWVIATGFR